MSGWLIIITALIYGAVAIDQYRLGNAAMVVVYASYACSNIGLYMAVTK
jgi:hypothetical protein